MIILPAHLAHSKALHPQSDKPQTGIAKVFAELRVINKIGDRIMNYMRDKWYSPALHFMLNYKFLTFALFFMALVLTLGSIGGGIIRTAFFPRIASDQVSIDLTMPNGTNEKVTDSIISLIQEKAHIVNQELTDEYLQGMDKMLFVNMIMTVWRFGVPAMWGLADVTIR